MINLDSNELVSMYYDGNRIIDIAKHYGVSAGTIYKILKNAGCVFRKTGFYKGQKLSAETIEKRRQKLIGKHLKDDTKNKISEALKVHYNGLNGYGNTKKQNRGYIVAYAPEHPNAHKDGYVMLHTIIMEQKIGRYLKPNEVVHHINHKRDDNRIENLKLMDKKEHMSMHMIEYHRNRRNGLSTAAK